jgi:hypothetical protein
MTLAGLLADSLGTSFEGGLGREFDEYLRTFQTNRWIIFSDYVLGDKTRPNDVYAFSIVPGGVYLDPVFDCIRSTVGGDIKSKKSVNAEFLRLLIDPRLFTFCFTVDRSGLLSRNRIEIAQSLKSDIKSMEAWENAGGLRPTISRFKSVARNMLSPSFNRKLFDQTMVSAALASVLTYQIWLKTAAERVGWFSDRDAITTGNSRIATDIYSLSVNDLCRTRSNNEPGPALGVIDHPSGSEKMWCDSMLRIPDHFAGAISVWDMKKNMIHSELPKYLQMIQEAIAGNNRVQIAQLSARIDYEAGTHGIYSSRVVTSKRNPDYASS